MVPIEPAALASAINAEGLQPAWDELSRTDRAQYSGWVDNAPSEWSARRRADVVADRVRENRGWTSPIRREWHYYFSVPPDRRRRSLYLWVASIALGVGSLLYFVSDGSPWLSRLRIALLVTSVIAYTLEERRLKRVRRARARSSQHPA